MDSNFVKVKRYNKWIAYKYRVWFYLFIISMLIAVVGGAIAAETEETWAIAVCIIGIIFFLCGFISLCIAGNTKFVGEMVIYNKKIAVSKHVNTEWLLTVGGRPVKVGRMKRELAPVSYNGVVSVGSAKWQNQNLKDVLYAYYRFPNGKSLHFLWLTMENYVIYIDDTVVMMDGCIYGEQLASVNRDQNASIVQPIPTSKANGHGQVKRFVYEKEEHKAAHVIATIIRWYCVIQAIAGMIMLANTGYDMFGAVAMIALLCALIVPAIILSIFSPSLEGGMLINGIQTYVSISPKEVRFTVDGYPLRCEKSKKDKIPVQVYDNNLIYSNLNAFYASYGMEDGKTIHFVAYNTQYFAIYVDSVIVMQNGQIYQNILDSIFVQKNVVETPHRDDITVQPMQLPTYALEAINGIKAGESWQLDQPLRIGRNANSCQIVFNTDAQGISRVHCEISVHDGKAYIKDLGATYGTMLSDGTMVKDYQEYELTENMTFTMGVKESFMLIKEQST